MRLFEAVEDKILFVEVGRRGDDFSSVKGIMPRRATPWCGSKDLHLQEFSSPKEGNFNKVSKCHKEAMTF
jgi:hypothetical protein